MKLDNIGVCECVIFNYTNTLKSSSRSASIFYCFIYYLLLLVICNRYRVKNRMQEGTILQVVLVHEGWLKHYPASPYTRGCLPEARPVAEEGSSSSVPIKSHRLTVVVVVVC